MMKLSRMVNGLKYSAQNILLDLLCIDSYILEARKPGPGVIKRVSCSTPLRTKFILLINVKMPIGILTFLSMIHTTSKTQSMKCLYLSVS